MSEQGRNLTTEVSDRLIQSLEHAAAGELFPRPERTMSPAVQNLGETTLAADDVEVPPLTDQ